MKTLIKILAVAIVSLSFASTGFAGDEKAMTKDHMMMKDGKVMMVMGGKTTPVDKDVVLANGTKVTPAGAVTMKDGMKSMMKEGEMMGMDGEMMTSDGKPHGH